MKREGLEYAMMLAVVCLAIVGAVVIMSPPPHGGVN